MIIPQDVVDKIDKAVKDSHADENRWYRTSGERDTEAGRRKGLLEARAWVTKINALTDERL